MNNQSKKTKIKKIISIFIVAIMLLGVSSSTANAHGFATTKSELVDKYLVQMEYDTIGNISAGGTTSFTFELLDPSTEETIDFDRVFVRIMKKEGYYPLDFNGNLLPIGVAGVKSARVTIWVSREGEYNIETSYYKGDKKLVEHTFAVTVDPSNNSEDGNKMNFEAWYRYLISIFIGVMIGMTIRKKIKNSNIQ